MKSKKKPTKKKVKPVSYQDGIYWIAHNDDSGWNGRWDDQSGFVDLEIVSTQISCLLLADLFGVSAKQVGKDVVRLRKQHLKERGL